ncbi:MAG: nuclear transport factor 2 family protein [Pseudoclavibacter sp.]
MSNELNARTQARLDRDDLFDLVRRERFARDQRRFDIMRSCFLPDARVRTSWFDGNGSDYVDSTNRLIDKSGNSKHWVFPAFEQVNGDRATVESPAMIFNRVQLEGIEVDFHVFCRFHSRAVRVDDAWKLASFEVLFERDVLNPVNPGDQAPVDLEVLATMRPSYKFLSYIHYTLGRTVNPDLYGDDRRDSLTEFLAAEDRWLETGE